MMDGLYRSEEFTFETFYTAVNGYYQTAAVKAAIELGLFDALRRGGKTIEEAAEACGASVRGVRILCYYLVSIGFLLRQEDRFLLDRTREMFLDSRSPGYLGGSIQFLLSSYIMSAFDDMTDVVRTGRISLPQNGVVAAEHPQWVEFARAIAPMMALPSALVANALDLPSDRPLRVLDIAAGHGLFGIAFAQKFRNAQVTFQDWENVLAVTREKVEAAGVAHRARFLPGDAFEVDYGGDYDVVLLMNFLHHFETSRCETILRKVLASLRDGGCAVTFEFIANEDRTSPTIPATFSMMMLATTPAGEVYTFGDLATMHRNAGFDSVELKSIPPAIEKVVVAYKRTL